MRFPICAVAALAAAVPAGAQDEDEQLWLKLSAKTPLSKDAELGLEMNQRVSNDEGGIYESQYLARIRLNLGDGFKLTGGVNRVVAVDGGRVDNTEWRPRQELGFPALPLGLGKFDSRIRFEQRFRSDGDDVGHRVRPEIIYTLPLTRKLDLELGHESYFNLNTTDFGQRSGHERMRNFVALNFPFLKRVIASVGYLNQYRFNRGRRDRMEHALTLGLSAGF